LRRSQDIAVRTLRQLIDKYGHRSQEQLGNFEVRAMHIVRLYIEEAFRRQLVDSETPVLKSALCGFMVSMRNIEHNTLPQDTTKNKNKQTLNKYCINSNCIFLMRTPTRWGSFAPSRRPT
jgi:hypothetical protein